MPGFGEILLQLAAEAVSPVVAAIPAMAGFAVEKAVNHFGPPIAKRVWDWLRGKPRKEQEEALEQLASVPAAQAGALVREIIRQQAPSADPLVQELAVRYLSALPGAVRQSLVSGPGDGRLSLPCTFDLQQSASVLRLLPVSAPPFPVPGDLPGSNYYLEEVIGTGGFGAVYRARYKDSTLHYLQFAIKVCLDPEMQTTLVALQNELQNLRELQKTTPSARVVRLYGYRLDPPPFLVYEFVDGGDLGAYLLRRQQETGGRVPPDEVRGWVQQIVEGLAFAHAHGLIHRDLKPANVLVAGGSLKLADFGLGRVMVDYARAHSQIGVSATAQLKPDELVDLFRGAGTPLYMSDEQREGSSPDPRHDLHSLGVMWYQLLLGDVTKPLPHKWKRVLGEECLGAGDQIKLIEACLGMSDHPPKDAGQVLDLMRKPFPPPSSISIESLHPPTVNLAPGSSATVVVQISRQNCGQELRVSVSGLPSMVTSPGALLAMNQTQTQIVLNAAVGAAPTTTDAQVTVHSSGVQDTVAVLPVSVTAPAPPPPPGPAGMWPPLAAAGMPDNQGRWLVYLDAEELPYPGQWWHFSWGHHGNPDPFCLTNAGGQQIRQPSGSSTFI